MSQLSGPYVAPASGGKPRKLVILLHGVGADGNDLIGLAGPLAGLLPDAGFIAPNAPEPCDMAPMGYQWFSLQERQASTMLAGIAATAPLLDAFIDDQLQRHDLRPAQLALLGFSQGTMMALHVAPRRSEAVAAVLGYSGALLAGDRLAAEARCRPPVLLIHGDADPVVPVQAQPAAVHDLQAAGFAVQWSVRPGLGHGIDPFGIEHGANFLAAAFADSR